MKTISIHGRQYTVYNASGKVEESGKNMETRVHGGGGGGYSYGGTGGTAPVSISSTTVVHDQIFLTDKNGAEHAFQLQDFDVACRTGNEISVLWAIKKGKPSGKYIAVLNHSTRNDFFHDKALKNMFRFNLWYFLGGGFGAGLLFGHDFFSGVMGLMLGLLVWALIWDFSGLKRFKADAAKYIAE
ncbi:MAG: hypothetical protein JWQ57_3906 [Mucilaginibacter sp.]|nr:hypothetical protein [Mucilaginibacter sp.]